MNQSTIPAKRHLANDIANAVTCLQLECTARWYDERSSGDTQRVIDTLGEPLFQLVQSQHRFNFELWNEEDQARRPNILDSELAQLKRNIDALNQQRNDAIERLDELLATTVFGDIKFAADAPCNSETVGSIIDRLSIAGLKLHHMRRESQRVHASTEHHRACAQKAEMLNEQHERLSQSLAHLIAEIVAGTKRHLPYYQFKMYNDPSLNPAIYDSEK